MSDLRVDSLISLWETSANDHNVFSRKSEPPYVYASYLMRSTPEGWNPYQLNENQDCVFSSWLHAIGFFTIHRNTDNFPVFLEQVKKDMNWWGKSFGPLEETSIPMAREFLAGLSGRYMGGNEDIVSKCNQMVDLLVDVPLFKEPSLQKELLRVAVSADFVDIVERLLKNGADVNALYRQDEIVHIDHMEYQRYGFNGREEGKNDTRRLAFFIRSPEMFECLDRNKCDWFLKDSSGESVLSVLSGCQAGHYLSGDHRVKVLKKMTPLELKEKEKDPQGFVWKNVRPAQRLDDIARVVSGINQYELKGPKGENFMHLLALDFPWALKKYAAVKKGAALLSQEDDSGLLPIEYAICNPFHRLKKDQDFLKTTFESSVANGGRKLNWLKVMTKLVEDRLSHSLAEANVKNHGHKEGQIPSSWWDMPTGVERVEVLKSPSGQDFIKVLCEKNYRNGFGFDLYAQLLCEKNYRNGFGFDLYAQFNPAGEYSLEKQLSFYEKAETKEELAVAYMGFLGRFAPSMVYFDTKKAFPEEIKVFDSLVNKAIDKGVDLNEINESFLSGERGFSNINPEKFKTFYKLFDKMESIKSLVERHRLNESFGDFSKKTLILKDAL